VRDRAPRGASPRAAAVAAAYTALSALFPSQQALLDARYAIETADGAVIEVISQGMRHMRPEVAARVASGESVPFSDYYMRTAIRLQTGHPGYQWVNRSLFLGAGGKIGDTVSLSIYRVG